MNIELTKLIKSGESGTMSLENLLVKLPLRRFVHLPMAREGFFVSGLEIKAILKV